MDRIRIAGHTFGYDIRSSAAKALLRPYACHDVEPEVVIEISEADRRGFEEDGQLCSFYILHKKIAEYLLGKDVLLFHGSCLALDGNGILFTAPSGTGKSTHARLWRERFGGRVEMINDDKPLLAFEPDGTVRAYGSPWCGKEQIGNNTDAPLRAIVYLRQGEENKLRRLPAPQALSLLITQALMPQDFQLKVKAMSLINRLASVPIYEMECTPTPGAVDLSLSALTENL